MSVLIKDMKMPDSCAVCRFAGKGGYHMERIVCMFTGKNEDAKNVDRLPNCPLVALPDKHGRLVDADATIKEIKARNPDDVSYEDAWAITCIEHAPTVEPEPHWIPCSERLPEEDVEVLISYRYKEGEGDTSHTYIDITTYGQMYFGGNKVGDHKHWRAPFEYFESNYDVIAWMPLPECYREGKS